MKKDIETDANELHKIYIEKEIGSLFYFHNEREKSNSLEKTIQFLNKLKPKIIREGFVNVRVEPIMEEGDENNGDGYYIKVYGYRKETKNEFKIRITHMYNDRKRRGETAIRDAEYYGSKGFEKELKAFSNIIGK